MCFTDTAIQDARKEVHARSTQNNETRTRRDIHLSTFASPTEREHRRSTPGNTAAHGGTRSDALTRCAQPPVGSHAGSIGIHAIEIHRDPRHRDPSGSTQSGSITRGIHRGASLGNPASSWWLGLDGGGAAALESRVLLFLVGEEAEHRHRLRRSGRRQR